MQRGDIRRCGFALYEVLLGLTIFVVGVLALGRAVENCMNASDITAEDARVRQILANRMAEVQASPGTPDVSKEFKVETGYGAVKLVQKSRPAGLKAENVELGGISEVTLTVLWKRRGVEQSKQLSFYVYRAGAT